jgi:GxxExxY protein
MAEFLHGEITQKIIGAAFEVWKVLGYGFLEKVYENSVVEELKRIGAQVEQQRGIDVYYTGVRVGEYVADLPVEGSVIVEIKAEREYNSRHEAQLLNYLKATGLKVGLLISFGEGGCEFKRLVM